MAIGFERVIVVRFQTTYLDGSAQLLLAVKGRAALD